MYGAGTAGWQRGASPGQRACLTRALFPPRPADQQARGQGAARLAAQHPAPGGEPGAQETEGRIPGVSRTSAPNSGAGFHFLFKPKFVYTFLNYYEFKATFVRVKLKSIFWSGLVWLGFFSAEPDAFW